MATKYEVRTRDAEETERPLTLAHVRRARDLIENLQMSEWIWENIDPDAKEIFTEVFSYCSAYREHWHDYGHGHLDPDYIESLQAWVPALAGLRLAPEDCAHYAVKLAAELRSVLSGGYLSPHFC